MQTVSTVFHVKDTQWVRLAPVIQICRYATWSKALQWKWLLWCVRQSTRNTDKQKHSLVCLSLCVSVHTSFALSLLPLGSLCPSTALSPNQIIYCLQMACTAVSVSVEMCVWVCVKVCQGYYSQFKLKCKSSHVLRQLWYKKRIQVFVNVNDLKDVCQCIF